MSYTPSPWSSGDTVTAARLNNIEQGVANAGGGVFIIPITLTIDGDDGTYSTTVTVSEIATALTDGKLCVCVDSFGQIFPFVEDDGSGNYSFQRLVKWPQSDSLQCLTLTISSSGVEYDEVGASVHFS